MSFLKSPRKRFERFCYANRNKGIPNLMLYIVLGSAIVYIMSLIDESQTLYRMLCFDRNAILHGQVWRLITYPFTYNAGNILLMAISLMCFYSLGRAMENIWGTCKFNLFYFTGVILMDIFGMIFKYPIPMISPVTVAYLNLSLLLGYATLYPDAQFLLFFIIPIRAWILAIFDLVLTLYDVIQLSTIPGLFPYNLFPLVAIANYFLFFGKDVLNVIPISWRANASRLFRKKPKTAKKSGSIPFNAGSYQASTATVKAPYTHRCTICGRTDVTNPELEFRYCSKCNGYYCYCEDHINNHEHIK